MKPFPWLTQCTLTTTIIFLLRVIRQSVESTRPFLHFPSRHRPLEVRYETTTWTPRPPEPMSPSVPVPMIAVVPSSAPSLSLQEPLRPPSRHRTNPPHDRTNHPCPSRSLAVRRRSIYYHHQTHSCSHHSHPHHRYYLPLLLLLFHSYSPQPPARATSRSTVLSHYHSMMYACIGQAVESEFGFGFGFE